jgi:hypothetical protein
LFGKAALVLNDLPCNTRREAGASNSDYDKLSLSSMMEAADVIEKLPRPHGHAFIVVIQENSSYFSIECSLVE